MNDGDSRGKEEGNEKGVAVATCAWTARLTNPGPEVELGPPSKISA